MLLDFQYIQMLQLFLIFQRHIFNSISRAMRTKLIFLLIVCFLMQSSRASDILNSTQAYIRPYFDLSFFPLMDLANSLIKNGGFSASSDGSPIIPSGKTSVIVSGDSLNYWLAESGQCLQVDLINQTQVMQLCCDGKLISISQIITAPKTGIYYLYFEFTATQPTSPYRQYFSVFLNGGQILKIKPFDYNKQYVVIQIQLVQGINTLTFNGESLDASTNVVLDNVAIYAKKTQIITTTSQTRTYLALASGSTFRYSSAMEDFSDAPLINETNPWCSKNNKQNEYFQINAPQTVNFTSILIQGYKACQKSNTCINCFYIKSISIKYSLDGVTWLDFNNGTSMTANTDAEAVVKITLISGVVAKSIRIIPLDWNKRICTHVDVWYTTLP